MVKFLFDGIIFSLLILCTTSQEFLNYNSIIVKRYANISYKSGGLLSFYEQERCKLDIYMPASNRSNLLPVIIYFHGGSLISGDKSEGWTDWSNHFGFKFSQADIAVVAVNYRLSGHQGIRWPSYLQDAAASVAWVANHIDLYGGDPNNIFVMGFSAGAYLTHMLSIDFRWYATVNFDRSRIRGYIPISGQTRAHPTVAADLDLQPSELMTFRPDAMPLGQVKRTEKPIHLFVGGYENQTVTDNYLYYNQLINQGSVHLFIFTNPQKDHLGMRDGLGDDNSLARTKILDFIQKYAVLTG